MKHLPLLLALSVLLACRASAVVSWSPAPPSSTLSGQSYSVGATQTVYPASVAEVRIFKNGANVAYDGNGGYGEITVSTSTWSTDSGPQTVYWSAEGYAYGIQSWYTPESSITAATTIIGNNPPTFSLGHSSSLTTSQSFTVSINAYDQDGDLHSMGIRWQGMGLVGGPWMISGSSASNSVSLTAPASPGTIYVRGEVWDNASHGVTGSWESIPVKIATSFSFSGATYDGSQKTVSVSTNPSGAPHTLSGDYTKTNAGTYYATATATGDYTGSYTGPWTISKADQTISFGSLSNKTYYDDTSFSVSASASSGLPVSFSVVSGPATVSGSTVTITGAGNVTIRASQSGNSNYNAAPSVDQPFTVYPKPTTFTFTFDPGGPNYIWDGGTKHVYVTPNPLAATYDSTGTWSASAVNSYTATATATGNYTGSRSAGWSIGKVSQTITFDPLSNKTYLDPAFSVSASASSGLPVSFSVVSGPATISGSTVTITGAGNVTIRASQSGNSNYNAAPSVDQPFTVYPKPTTFTFTFDPGGPNYTWDGGTKHVYVTPNPLAATYDSTGTWSASAVNSYTATATATGNFTGSGSRDWSISPTYALSVIDGSGLGSYTSGTAVPIAANAPAAGMAFSNWTHVSGPGAIANANAASTTFTMGAGAATVRANYSDMQAPSVPAGLAATNVTSTSFTLNWAASTDNVGVTLYEVFRNGVSQGATSSLSMNQSGLSAGTLYSMTVRARDAAANWSAQSGALPVTTLPNAPGAPTALEATAVTGTGFTANWSAVGGATGYRLDVSASGSFASYVSGYQDRDVGAATAFGVTGLSANTTYYYRVRAVNAGGTGGSSNTITVSDTIAPSVPANLRLVSKTATSIAVAWDASSDNFAVQDYECREGANAPTVTNALTATFSGLSPATAYAFSVRARDAAVPPNASAYCSPLSVTTDASLSVPVITSATSVSGATGAAFAYQITATNSPTSYSATGLPAGLSINPSTGLISGTPTATGTFSVALGATNASGTGTAALSLNVTSASGADLNVHLPLP